MQDTAPPAPAAAAALAECAAAITESRRLQARTLHAITAPDAVTQTGHRTLATLLSG